MSARIRIIAFGFIIRMSATALKAAISKIEREGFAVNGASLGKKKNESGYFVHFQGKQKGPQGQKALYVGSPDDPRYKYWRGMIDRRNKLKQYRRELKILEQAAAIKSPKEKPSVEWYTPPDFVEMARSVMGGIDLDPASNPTAQGWVKAMAFYTKDDDGLKQPWSGRVWCNPPYGKFTRLFMQRGLEFYRAGDVSECIFLVNRTGAAWYVDLLEHFDSVCQVRKRISFWTPEGKPQGSPRYYNDFLYLGSNKDVFWNAFEGIGRMR